jgi:hypothetical protein|tara:strand:- start:201 stop:407 length:207 start_codon:yes stop_codon:yes gene_type:complete
VVVGAAVVAGDAVVAGAAVVLGDAGSDASSPLLPQDAAVTAKNASRAIVNLVFITGHPLLTKYKFATT